MTANISHSRRGIALILAFALLLSLTFSGCARQGTEYAELPEFFSPEHELLTVGEQLGFDVIDIKYYYTTLTDKQKQIYLNMYETVENMDKGSVLLAEGATSEDLSKATAAYFADNPQHFWIAESMETCWTVTDNISIGVSKFFNAILSLFPWVEKRTDYTEYTDAYCKMSYIYKSEEKRDEAQQELKQKMIDALSGISPEDSAFDRELYIHDWIAENCTYDNEAYEQFLQSGTVGDRVNVHTVYGALVEQTATCAGYARAMQLLLSQAGIETRFISGVSQTDDPNSSGQSHAWNIVFFDGQPYHVDLTWNDKDLWGIKDGVYDQVQDDSSGFSFIGNRTEHKYFNVTEEVISGDHWGFDPQYANAVDYNYFTYKSLDISFPEDSFRNGIIDELCRLASNDQNLIEIYLGTNTNNHQQYIDLLFDAQEALFYKCLELANDKIGQDYFREDMVYYGIDENSGIVCVYTVKN